MRRHTRRQLFGATASLVGAGILAGCTGNVDSAGAGGENASGESGDTTAQSSFFVVGDFASHIAGNAATANTVVPVGQHGHGWEPGPQVQKAVLDSDLFVYTVEGFQPWADDLVASLREDDADITMVKAGSGIDLLEEDDDHGHDEANGTEDERGHDSESEHDGEQENQSDSGHNETDSKRDEGHRNENDSSHDEEHGNESSDEHGHAHQAEADPHFWLDPMRAKQAVSNIRQEFVDLDSANADAYATNADQYRSRLEDLDSTIQSALNNRSKNVVFVAGHNAFRYLGERYEFEAETLTGLSPDDQPTPKDIERAQEIINEHGLEYVLADPLESQRAAQQLVAETSAREVLPLTPIPGQTQEWANKGWGYVEIMEQINLPTLKQALGAR